MHNARRSRYGSLDAVDPLEHRGDGRLVTAEVWDSIRRMDLNFVSQIEIARRTGLSVAVIRPIIKGEYPRPEE